MLLTKKEWVNRSELPEILKGHIDGHSCKIYKKSGLPLGMISGTNESNFQIYRGGYNCGHQFFYVPDSAVPDSIKNKNKAAVIPLLPKVNSNTEKILADNKPAIDAIEKDNIPIYSELLDLLPNGLTIEKRNSKEAYLVLQTTRLL